MTWKTIFNPFEKFDEKTLLIVGVIFFILFVPLCYWTNSCFISIYRISALETNNIYDLVTPTVISFITPIVILFALGKILYRKTRIIDIANMVLISQIPLVILLPFEKFSVAENAGENMMKYQNNPTGAFPLIDFTVMILFAILSLICLIYSVILFYNGFKTATNIKKWQHIVLFAVVTFLTVITCQIFNS